MNIKFLKAKNSEETFTFNGIYYHSLYSPSKEAERFVTALKIQKNPKLIIVFEPGKYYLYPCLKKIFPNAKIGIIRVINELKIENKQWDFSINYSNSTDLNIKLQNFTEDELLNSELINWPVSENFFSNQLNSVWKEYKNSLEFAKTILITRQYFEKKWLINSINFFKYTNKIGKINKIEKDVVITASGPSLKFCLEIILKNRKNLFIAALSSSVSTLINYKIIPDLCITTDGGFYALKHLKKIKNIPIAVSSEANTYKSILKSNLIIPLNYDDGISNDLFNYVNFQNIKAKRNGTVSGTALELLCNLTNKNIFFCGLDLNCNKGFSHAQPNEIEIENSINDNRIFTKEKRIKNSEFSSKSLKIYRNWFSNNNFNTNIFRVIDDKTNSHLGKIQDITTIQFNNLINNEQKIEDENYFIEIKTILNNEKKQIINKLKSYINENSQTEYWKNQIFPLDYISLNHAENSSKIEIEKKLNEKNTMLVKKLMDILNDR